MPTATNGDFDVAYETGGAGESVVFLSDLGCGPWLWSWQAPALADGFEVIVPALRGTDGSDAPGLAGSDTPGPDGHDVPEEYSISAMAADLEAVLSDHAVREVTVVGAGFGGAVALAYAREYSRAARLALFGTSANGARFDASAFLGNPSDLDSLLSGEFRAELPGEVERIVGWRREEDAPEAATRAQAAAIDGFDATEWLHEVAVPTLVLHGEEDAVVPPEAGRGLAEALPRGEFESFESGSHFFFVEQARLATDALVGFLEAGRAR